MSDKILSQAVNKFKGDWSIIPLGGINSDGFYVTSYSSEYLYFGGLNSPVSNKDDFNQFVKEHITPPIELIDGKAYQFDHINRKNLLGFYVSETDELNVNGNHFSSEHSTNIVLLTPEGEK